MESFRQDRPLVESIALATRGVHARLNKLIVARLPLALPPRAADPAPYLSGLLHVAPIYTAFEEAWRDILDTPPRPASTSSLPDGCDPDMPLLDTGSLLLPKHEQPRLRRPSMCGRMHSVLERLYLPDLMRSDRLREDIQAMTGWPHHIVQEQLQTISKTGYLSDFINHIKRAVTNKPHVLLAYSYIMFMALFAGGRFIRASLESAGEDFWEQEPSPVKPTWRASQRNKATEEDSHAKPAQRSFPLNFFHFAAPLDGEDLKREYKQRLSDSDGLLTPREKHDIVQEAICIFENITLLVTQLDMVCAGSEEDEHASGRADSLATLADLLKNPLGYRFRDSLAVTKERRERNSAKRSSGHEDHCSIARAMRARQPGTTSSYNSTKASHAARIPQAREYHPLSSRDGIELCPAMSKSIKFDKAPPQPARSREGSRDSAVDLVESFKLAARPLKGANAMNWVLALAFAIVFLGALVMGRRSVNGNLA